MNSGVELIAAERQRQIEEEGWTPDHDDEHDHEELAEAAACYALHGRGRLERHPVHTEVPKLWPASWARGWWKPTRQHGVSGRIRELEKAGALIAAEIDRLLRLDPAQ